MSEFQELSQAIGVAVHKRTKEEKELYGITDTDMIYESLRYDHNFRKTIKKLIEHTIKST